MPAYNAARTIEQTYREIPMDLVDTVVVTDDASRDETVEIARRRAEHAVRREALRVSHRLPRVHARGARVAAAARELGRLRVRQPDAGPDPGRGLPDRRGELPGRLLRGGVLDQLLALGALRP